MAIDVSKLEVSVVEGARWRRTLNITVPQSIVSHERRAAVTKLASSLKLPGFRAGRVPASVVEKRFGRAVDQELVDRVIGEAYRETLKDRELSPISEGEVGEIDYKPDSDLRFDISFDVAPKVEITRTGGFRIPRKAVVVDEAEVDSVLTRMREQAGTWVPVEAGTPEDGDRVSVRIQRLEEDEVTEARPYEFVLGREEAIPDVEAAIRTLSPGESGEFTVRFPDDSPNADRRGTEQRLSISLEGRKVLEMPSLDDAFAASAGDFESLEALVQQVRDDLHEEAERTVDAEVRGRLMEEILSANPFDIPESMIDRYVRSALGNPENVSPEQLAEAKEQLRPRATFTVKRHLVVDRIAEDEGLAASTEELDDRIEAMAERSERSPHEVYARLQKAGQLEVLEREITERKVFEHLKEQSEIIEEA